jgi:hypothetical protein
MITQSELKQILHYDESTGIFRWLIKPSINTNIGDIAGGLNGEGYVHIKIKGTKYKAHRLAWLYVHGTHPVNVIDHINRVKNDNRLVNLRDVTKRENCLNQYTTGIKFHKRMNKWQAVYSSLNGRKHLGTFDNIIDARAAHLREKRSQEKA